MLRLCGRKLINCPFEALAHCRQFNIMKLTNSENIVAKGELACNIL